jgi:acyl carrier protein
MNRETVLEVVLKNIKLNVEGFENSEIDPSRSIADLGASSLDIVEIVSSSMRELNIRVPRTELAGLKNINQLVDLLAAAKEKQLAGAA